MNILKDLVNQVSKDEIFIETIVCQVAKATKRVNNVRLGIIIENAEHASSHPSQIRKGDIVLNVTSRTAGVATGECTDDDKPIIVMHNGSRKSVDPKLVIVGTESESSAIKQLVARLSNKYPHCRILAIKG